MQTMTSDSSPTTYDDNFFDYISLGSRRSAAIVAPLILKMFPAQSVCDIGSGRGAWLVEWQRAGVRDYLGVDGDYVDVGKLMVPAERFVTKDLTKAFDLGRTFDLVTSLEVGEHIVPEATDVFVDNLSRHSDAILFSAATPGQGGTFHVNEQTYDFWRKRFSARGYRTFDLVRPNVSLRQEIEPWYRYNTLFFARGAALTRLASEALAAEIAAGDPVPDWSPLSWRARKAIIRRLPVSWTDRLVEIKHRYVMARGQ
jgi:SAM-dependent methyltransferase